MEGSKFEPHAHQTMGRSTFDGEEVTGIFEHPDAVVLASAR